MGRPAQLHGLPRPGDQTLGRDSDSGTYEYFGEQVFCKKCFADADPVAEGFDSARGYQNSADDNQIVNGLTGDEYAIGYFGYAYYEENANELSVVAIANNDTHGVQDAGNAVAPETSTVADGSYARFSLHLHERQQQRLGSGRELLRLRIFDAGMDHVADVGYCPCPMPC